MGLMKKKKLRRKADEELIACLQVIKENVDRHEKYGNNSLNMQEDVMGEAKIERAKYLFLLREARYRGTTLY
jgi:hypothetical protein